jgi:hypothetical protein
MPIECSCSFQKRANFPGTGKLTGNLFGGMLRKPLELRDFAISMHQNRELTGNFEAKLLIPLELNALFGIQKNT